MQWIVSGTGGLTLGIFLGSLFLVGTPLLVYALLIAGLFAGAGTLVPRRAYSLGVVFFFFVALGLSRVTLTDTPLPQSFTSDLHHRVSYTGVVVADPMMRDTSMRAMIEIEKGSEVTRVLASVPRESSVGVGDTVRLTGVLLTPEPFATDDGRSFRYDAYLARDGVRFVMNFAFVESLTPAPWYSLPALLARIKHHFLDALTILPEPFSSLAGGLLIGGKSGLGIDLQTAFVRSGLIQIIVLSGYNVMIVAEWVLLLLARTPLSRRMSAGVSGVVVLLFVGIAGFSTTAVRALCMALIALFARATGRGYAAGRALLVVVFLMLLYNPLSLVFDPGFGLSVAATAGLIWLSPCIEEWFLKRQIAKSFLSEALATTLAAQVAVLPLLLYETGNLSFVAIPTNVIAAFLVPLAMALSAIAGLGGLLFGTSLLGLVTAFPAYLATSALVTLARESAAIPLAALSLPAFPFVFVLLAYAALVAFAVARRDSTTNQLMFAKKASI